MTHAKTDTYVKYMSVFFHVYHIGKILESIKEVEHFDNSSINAHVTSRFNLSLLAYDENFSYLECLRFN